MWARRVEVQADLEVCVRIISLTSPPSLGECVLMQLLTWNQSTSLKALND